MIVQTRQIQPMLFWASVTTLLALPIFIVMFLTQSFYKEQQSKTRTGTQHYVLEQKPLLHIIDAVLQQADAAHHYELSVYAQQTDIMRNSSQIICKQIQATILGQNNHAIQITADQGIIKQDEKLIYFPSNVQAKSDNATFLGSQITYHFNRHEFSSAQPFSVKNSIATVQATQGTINTKTLQAHLEGGVATTLTPHDIQPPQ